MFAPMVEGLLITAVAAALAGGTAATTFDPSASPVTAAILGLWFLLMLLRVVIPLVARRRRRVIVTTERLLVRHASLRARYSTFDLASCYQVERKGSNLIMHFRGVAEPVFLTGVPKARQIAALFNL